MANRAMLGAWLAASLAVAGSPICAVALDAAAVSQAQPSQRPDDAGAQPDDDVTIAAFLQQLEPIVQAADAEAFAALEGPLGSREDALEFARAEFSPGVTRVVVQERERQDVTLVGIPGGAYALTVDAFIEYGNRARVATWQLFLRRSGDSWNMIRQQMVSSVDNLYRLTLNTTKQYDVRNLAIAAEDLQLTVSSGTAFTIDTEAGMTGLVLMGRGNMRFSPAPETEKGQVRIFSGADVLDTAFDATFVRFGAAEGHVDPAVLVERPVNERDLKRAQQIFKDESPKSFAVDLADLTREAWTLLPGPDDFLAEIRTRRFKTLTYARSAAEPEDVSVFERGRHKNIALYASKEKLASRGRFYNEDDLAPIDVLDYDIDVTALPDREWIEGRAKMRMKVRTAGIGQLTIKLADTLIVRSIVTDRFGRMFNLRVTGQNTLLVNLPSFLDTGDELTLTVAYGGRLQPQAPDRETIALQDEPPPSIPPQFPEDFSIPRPEPSFLYSNRSFWYPQSTVTDYATATIRLTVPVLYGAVASGEPIGPPQVQVGRSASEARHVYEFKATRPARYLSFIVSRFIPSEQSELAFDDRLPLAGQGGEPDVDGAAALPGMRLLVQANPRQTRRSKQLLSQAGDIVRFYQRTVGDSPYPSFTIALVENLTPGGHSPAYFAQLNQPLPNSPLVWRNDPAAFENYPEFFMAHEIAHQWWGQGVGWQNYHEQWLSEGFSQYFAALYANQHRGDEVFQNVLKRMRRSAMNESDQGPVYLGYRVGHIKSDGRAFRAIVYNKGAMVLHMLRQMVGDDVFFRGIRRFYVSARFRKVGTEDFRAAMEAESGLDLSRFFERWIYGSTLPRATFTWRVETRGTGQVAVLRFEQAGEIFDMPALVTLSYVDGRSADVLVRIDDKVVERAIALDGALRRASISRRDVSLVDYK